MTPQLQQLFQPLTRFYQAQSQRDQRMLLILLVSLTLAFLWFAVITPLNQFRDQQHQHVQQAQQNYHWLVDQAPSLMALQQAQQHQGSSPQNLSSLISNSARELGIGVTRLETTGGATDPGVRVTLNSADFNQVVRWLGQLSLSQGIRVSQAQVNNPNRQGRADVVLNLVRTE